MAVATLSRPMRPVACAPEGMVFETEQRCLVLVRNEPHVATPPAVAAIGSTSRDVRLAPKRDGARATISRPRVQLRFVDEPGHAHGSYEALAHPTATSAVSGMAISPR